jgi:chaperone BCS1
MYLTSNDNNIVSIYDFLDAVKEEYENDLKADKNKYVFLIREFIEGRVPTVSQYIDKNKKTFDSMFFDRKDELVKSIKNFMDSEESYEKLGLPYTFGALFHGEPGTGKTSAIKAIANMTKRNICLVPTHIIDTRDKLLAVFISTATYMKIHETIFVFEEIDCGLWGEIICKREDIAMNSTHNHSRADKETNMISVMKECMEMSKEISKDEKSKLITLADILEVLDGMIDMHGRMIIMTTNHPDKIDPALLRPGRIDINMEFKRMTRDNIKDMYKLWFDRSIPSNVFQKMKDYVHTQADIGKLFKTKDMQAIHSVLEGNSKV